MKDTRQALATAFLIAIGLLQMTGDITDVLWMKGIGAAWGASPAPKVFSSAEGLETFSSQFFLIWKDQDGILHRKKLTPQVAKGLKGPYNRRNVYGAVLSYGPLLSQNEALAEAYESILAYAINKSGMLEELGIDASSISGSIIIEVVPRMGNTNHLNLTKEVAIHEK